MRIIPMLVAGRIILKLNADSAMGDLALKQLRIIPMKPDRIRAIMREKKLSCKQLASLVGVCSRTMESYIQGRRNMPERVELAIEAIKGE